MEKKPRALSKDNQEKNIHYMENYYNHNTKYLTLTYAQKLKYTQENFHLNSLLVQLKAFNDTPNYTTW